METDQHHIIEQEHDGRELKGDSWEPREEERCDVTDIHGLWMLHTELPELIGGVWMISKPREGRVAEIGCEESGGNLHQVMIPMPKVMKNPATHPSTLHDHDRARIARQTYSVNSSTVVFCQLSVRNLICCSARASCQTAGTLRSTTHVMVLLLELKSLKRVHFYTIGDLDVFVGPHGLGNFGSDL